MGSKAPDNIFLTLLMIDPTPYTSVIYRRVEMRIKCIKWGQNYFSFSCFPSQQVQNLTEIKILYQFP